MQLKNQLIIENKTIGQTAPTYIIAEMSANHCGDFEKAVDIIHAAKEAGADAIKLQTYTADTLTLNCKEDFYYIKNGPWQGQYLYDLYKKAFMPWDWHAKLQEVAKSIGITLFSSPFDFTAIDLLEQLNMPAYKIASPEIIDLPLIRRVAQTGKPIIISTGNATLGEIHAAVEAAAKEGAIEICLLKCTSTYPAPPESTNLKTIKHMEKSFGCPVGLSDHTLGFSVPIAAVALGAKVIEKHFILDRKDDSVDNFFSLTPEEMTMMITGIRTVEKAIGDVAYPLETIKAQRSLIAVRDIQKNELITPENIRSLRPGGGLEPKNFDLIINRKAKHAIKYGTPLQWSMVGESL